MAKQTGPILLTGTIGNVTYYTMNGKHYARQKSSLTGRRVKTSPRFENTMRSARRLQQGARLAAKVFRAVRICKDRELYQRIAGDAILLFKDELPWNEVETILMNKYKNVKEQTTKKRAVSNEQFVEKVLRKALKQNCVNTHFELDKDLWVLRKMYSEFYGNTKDPAWVYN